MRTYIQITAGRGPIECAAVVEKIGSELVKAVPGIEIIDREPHKDNESLSMSITFGFTSQDPEFTTALKEEWEGTIKYVATKNSIRPGHKRKNWFVGINFYTDLDLPEIDEKDIKYEGIRKSQKAGGQNVNRVSSAIRATHIPTGLSVVCMEERDQPRNKEKARERLLLHLRKDNMKKLDEQKKEVWGNHNNLERGNPKKTIYGKV